MIILSALITMALAAAEPCTKQKNFTLAIHGGYGETSWSEEQKSQRKALFEKVLRDALQRLQSGRSSLEVVEETLAALEDSGLVNAGKGGVANSAGEVRLDASIMEGRAKKVGAVGDVGTIKNPIRVARAAMEAGNRFFVNAGAEKFAAEKGFEPAGRDYFLHAKPAATTRSGTIGAVALDRCGDLAAGTSTGGYDSKPVGRVGDSPIIGAGTYAENGACAVSCTGEGEYFIRESAARTICLFAARKVQPLKKAAQAMMDSISRAGGLGGIIALDARGEVSWPFNHPEYGLLRGAVNQAGVVRVGAFGEPKPVTR